MLEIGGLAIRDPAVLIRHRVSHQAKCSPSALLRWRIAVAVGEGRGMNSPRVDRRLCATSFAGYRFPPEVILLAVRWYLRYGPSYRDVEELLAERGVEADHVTIYRWVKRFTPLLIDAARPCRHTVGGRWFVDETYVSGSKPGYDRCAASNATGRRR
jgi:hypothetical protein